ncbi:MAG: hypothetical protein AMXMBFR83_06190 [Phycisphaerae bacterium]
MLIPAQFLVLTILAAAPPQPPPDPADADKPFIRRRDLVYAEVHGTGLLMDVFLPKDAPNGLGLVDVISGAWHSDRGKLRDHERADLFGVFCARGYTVFAIRPGSITGYTGFDMVDHVKMGIRWVKAHAGEYGIDPDRLGLVGASAGGHLACLAAVTPSNGRPGASNPQERFDTRVAAVGVFFPPTDLLDYGGAEFNLDMIGRMLYRGGIGTHSLEDAREKARLLSPARLVKAPVPPFIIFHGDRDPMVPLQQSQVLLKALQAAGGQAQLVVKPGGGHPWFTIREEIVQMADWFDGQLKKPATRPANPQPRAAAAENRDVK